MIKINLDNEIIIMENVISGYLSTFNDLSAMSDLTEDKKIPIKGRGKIKSEYNLASLTLETTSNINPFHEESLCTLIIDISQEGYLTTGLISPLWFLTHKRTVCCIKKADDILAQFELIFNNFSIGHFVDDPVMVAKTLGNRIVCYVQGNAIDMDIIYTRSNKFEKYCCTESRRIQKIALQPEPKQLKPKQPKQQPPKPKQTEAEEIHPHCCACDNIDYWDALFNLPAEEQAYYGWERDPQ